MRLPVASDLHINAFSGGVITEQESGMTNAVIEERSGTSYITQRPSLDIYEDASAAVADARGRGIIYWDDLSAAYYVNNDTLYKSSYSTTISTALTAGTKNVKMLILSSTVIILDAENNQGFVLNNADSLSEITDGNFPPKDSPAVGLAFGGAVLDKYLFVMDVNGVIHNSKLNNASLFEPLGFKEAERETDAGVYLGKHHDNIVAYGASTIEFFYNAANSVGSPLNRRQDVQYNIGCTSGESVWEDLDRAFFVGVNDSGALGVYTLVNFQVNKISKSTLDSYLTQTIVKDGLTATGSGISAQGKLFYLLTIYTTPSDISPTITFCYDATTNIWSEWDTTVASLSKFPLMDWTTRQGSTERFGEGVFSNGDLVSLNDNLIPQDTLLASTYVVTDYVVAGYVVDAGAATSGIAMKSRLGMADIGSNKYKYPSELRHVADITSNSNTLTVKWADENNSSFNTGRSIDTSEYRKENQLGRFRRRNHQIEYSATEVLRLEALEIDMNIGEH